LEKKGKTNQKGFYSFVIMNLFFSRGLIFGVWSACASVGNIAGAAIAAAFLHYGYEYPFLVCVFLLICCAVVSLFAIVPSPDDVGMYDEECSFFF
jgi:OPA family glycerol-3-phosphate transporter-like MFS transporter 3